MRELGVLRLLIQTFIKRMTSLLLQFFRSHFFLIFSLAEAVCRVHALSVLQLYGRSNTVSLSSGLCGRARLVLI